MWPDDYVAVASHGDQFLARILVDRVLPAVNVLLQGQPSITPRECYVLDSSSASKLSFHVALPLVLSTDASVKAFARWMRITFEKCESPLAPLLDTGVYATRGNMRLPLCRKPFKPGASSDKPWLRPVSRVGDIEFAQTHDDATPGAAHAHTLALLHQHAWTFVDESHRRLDEALVGVDHPSPTEPAHLGHRRAGAIRLPRSLGSTPPAERTAPLLDTALSLYAHHAQKAPEAVTVDHHMLRIRDDDGAIYGEIHVRDAAATYRLYASATGNVFLCAASSAAAVAAAIVERALSDTRAATFAEWFAVGGALCSVDDGESMFAVWDKFSQRCPPKYFGSQDLAR